MNRVFGLVRSSSLGVWRVVSEQVRGCRKSSVGASLVVATLAGFAGTATADCATLGSTVTCTPGSPEYWTVGNGPATPAGTHIEVESGALISADNSPAISTGDGTTIMVRSGATVENKAVFDGGGNYGTGMNTIEFMSGNTLVIEQGASVLSTGHSGTGEAINPHGSGNLIVNHGTVDSQAGGSAIWLESGSGSNTIINGATGVISYKDGTGSVVKVNGTMAVDFTNQGRVLGSLHFADGDDALRIHTGSLITGAADGGGGDNLLTLNGAGSDTFTQAISNFQTLVKEDAGTWTFGHALQGTDITRTRVAGGTLVLGADASDYTGSMTVDPAGTLQTTAQFAPQAITDHGTVRFAQPDDATYAGLLSGTGGLEKTGAGTLTLATQQAITGLTRVAGGTLRAGAADTLSAGSAHAVAAGAVLETGGFDQTVAALHNAGRVSLLGAGAGSSLTVTGAYVGQGGILNLGTVLGDSGSPTDRLVLDGPSASASGHTTLQVTNLGGLGALTTGDGIEVVSARNGATTTAQTTKDAFALAGGHVDAGAYEYRLHAADAQGTGENWYLRSDVAPSSGKPGEPAEPGKPALPGAGVPAYRAEVPLFAALPAQLRQADLAMLGNLHRRVGDEDRPASAAQGAAREGWARAVYADLDIRQGGIAQARSDGHVSGVQAGTDLLATGDWRAGIYVGALNGGADVSGNARGTLGRVGHNDLQSRYLGAYATWANEDGLYADAVLQAGSHRYSVRPDGNPFAAGKARSVTASLEAGRSFQLAGDWRIEPQAQLIYQRSRFDDVRIGGAAVHQDADGGWIGRLGVRVKGDLATRAGRLQPYARANLYRAGAGTDIATFSAPAAATRIASASGYSAAEVAAGATLALTPAVNLYGEVGHLFDVGGSARVQSSVQGSVGLRVRW